MKLFILSALLLVPILSSCNEKAAVANDCNPADLCDASLVSVYDGDTLTMDIPHVHPVFGSKIGVRLAGIDTAEMRASRDCERRDAIAAREFVRERLQTASSIRLTGVQRDKYFRLLSDVTADGASLSSALIDAGLAVKYDGGTKQEWICKGN